MADYKCPHNKGVDCPQDKRHCETCGWSPEVDKRRREAAPGEKEGLFRHRPPARPPRPARRMVAKVNARGQVLEVYDTATEAAQRNNVSRGTVRFQCTGQTKQATKHMRGYRFCYVEDLQNSDLIAGDTNGIPE